jgi:hypothetical protein
VPDGGECARARVCGAMESKCCAVRSQAGPLPPSLPSLQSLAPALAHAALERREL